MRIPAVPRSLRPADALAGGAAAALVLAAGSDGSPVLAGLALPALGLPLAQALRRSPALPLALACAGVPASLAALALALATERDDHGIAPVVAAAAMLGACWWSVADERSEARPPVAEPVVERRPAPVG